MRETIIALHWVVADCPDYVFPLTYEYQKDTDGEEWVGVCLELGTAASADTLDEVKKQLNDAVWLQLNEIERLGFIEEYLPQNNIDSFVKTPRQAGARQG